MLFIILRLTSHISSWKFHREGRRAGRRAPASTVSTDGRAHAVAPYNRLSNCVPEYSRGTTSRRRSVLLTRVYPRRAGGIGDRADNKCSACSAPGRFRVARGQLVSLFRSSLGKYLTRQTLRLADTAEKYGNARACYRYLSRFSQEKKASVKKLNAG